MGQIAGIIVLRGGHIGLNLVIGLPIVPPQTTGLMVTGLVIVPPQATGLIVGCIKSPCPASIPLASACG